MQFRNSALRTVVSLVLALIVLLAPAVPVGADTVELKKGDPAPSDGVLFDAPAAEQAVIDLNDARVLRAEKEALDAQIAALKAQVAALEQAAALKDREIALYDQKDKMRDLIEQHLKGALDADEKSIAIAQKAAQVAIDAAEKSNAALEKMQGKLDAANKRGFWGTVLGLIGGALTGWLVHP